MSEELNLQSKYEKHHHSSRRQIHFHHRRILYRAKREGLQNRSSPRDLRKNQAHR